MIRKEVHTRTIFAHDRGLEWYHKMKECLRGGNIMSSVPTRKFMQARRIYVYYTQEYQRNTGLPLIGDSVHRINPKIKFNPNKIKANSAPLGTTDNFHISEDD